MGTPCSHIRGEASCSCLLFLEFSVSQFQATKVKVPNHWTGSISSYLHQADRLHWTSEMSRYLEDLVEESNSPDSLTLVTLVKIRRVLEKAYYSPADGRNRDRMQSSNIPPAWVAGVLRMDLDKIRDETASLSQDPGKNLSTLKFPMITLSKID